MSTPARISDRDIARVRELNPIADVAREFGYELEPSGESDYVTPCLDSLDPQTRVAFSMSVVPARGMFYCQHCGTGGDVITLVEKEKKIPFAEAVEYLARRAGLTLHPAASPPDPGAVRAARALRAGIPEAIDERDVDALISNLAGWFGTDLDVREAALLPDEETS